MDVGVEEKSVINARTLVGAKKGRPVKGTPKPAHKKQVVVANLSKENMTYILRVAEITRRSYGNLVNEAISICRQSDALSQLTTHEPAQVKKARELLTQWESGPRKIRSAPLSAAARARRARTNNGN